MTGHDLRELQELMMREYVRHLMFLATLPFYLMRETVRARATAGDRRGCGGADSPLRLASQTRGEQ
jgi:hypothetical protein